MLTSLILVIDKKKTLSEPTYLFKRLNIEASQDITSLLVLAGIPHPNPVSICLYALMKNLEIQKRIPNSDMRIFNRLLVSIFAREGNSEGYRSGAENSYLWFVET